MVNLKDRLIYCELEIVKYTKCIEEIKEKLVDESILKIGDKVKRLDGIGGVFYISRIWYNTDMKVLLFGIKENQEDLYDTYSSLNESKLVLQ
jgi:hypothetical protein